MEKTDWTKYYEKKSMFNRVTRKYVQDELIKTFRRICGPNPRIIEGGGANSCFFQALYERLRPERYTAIDNNEYGLRLFSERIRSLPDVFAVKADLLLPHTLQSPEAGSADLVFSVGLIEHFDEAGTALVVETHFRLVRPDGGMVALAFPTSTRKYRITRKLMEFIRVWKFHDERPLLPDEVERAAAPFGRLMRAGF